MLKLLILKYKTYFIISVFRNYYFCLWC